MESHYVGSRYGIQSLKEDLVGKDLQPQPIKGWIVTEQVFYSL